MIGGWLQRSGQAWKIRTAMFAAVAGMVFVVLPFILSVTSHKSLPDWVIVLTLAGFMLLVANVVLPLLVHCPVCGVQMETSSTARRLSRGQRLRWIESLHTCPVCGDDGCATLESRSRWSSGAVDAERPYWSPARVLLGILALVLLAGGSVWLGGRYRVR